MLGKRTRVAGVGAAAALLFGAAACGGGGGDGGGGFATINDCNENPNTCNSAKVQTEGEQSFSFAIVKDIKAWNVNSVKGNTLSYGYAMAGLLPEVFTINPDFTTKLNKDVMVSAKQVNDSPQTIEYKIQPDAKWMDGTPISANDFIYNWKVANGEDCPDCTPASTGGYEQIKSIESSNNGKTVTVVFNKPYTDWKQLWSATSPMYPAHIAAKHGDLDTPEGLAKAYSWFNENVPTYSGGPFKVKNWNGGKALTLVPNENWYGKGPKLDRLVYRIIDDQAQMPTALQNGEVDAIVPQPQVDLIEQVKQIPDVNYKVTPALSWEHYDLNLDNKFLAKKPLRKAMFTAIDRQKVLDKTVAQFSDSIKKMNNHNLVPGQPNYYDTVTPTGHGSGNVQKAKQILTDAGYQIKDDGLYTPEGKKVPAFTMRYTGGNAIRKTESELFKSMVAPLGVDINIRTTDDLGGTLSSGQYDVIVFGWIAGPFPFNGAQQLWTCGSESNYGGWCNEKATKLFQEAAASTDQSEAYAKMKQADKILSEAAYVLPLYQKPNFMAMYERYGNVRPNGSNAGPPYNVAQWGVEASAN